MASIPGDGIVPPEIRKRLAQTRRSLIRSGAAVKADLAHFLAGGLGGVGDLKGRIAKATPALASPAKGPATVVDISEIRASRNADAVLSAATELIATRRLAEARRFLRDAFLLGDTQKSATEITRRASELDPEFVEHVTAGDQARDARDWEEAENRYEAALNLYPLHPGYLIQSGHAAKERGHLAEAEVKYRSAWALGAPLPDVLEHLLYVAGEAGRSSVRREALRLDREPAQCPPNRHDLSVFGQLLWGRTPSVDETLKLLRSAQTLEQALAQMVRSPEFLRKSRLLVDLIKETAR